MRVSRWVSLYLQVSPLDKPWKVSRILQYLSALSRFPITLSSLCLDCASGIKSIFEFY